MIVVERRDRLARFGVEHRHAALAPQGRGIVVVDAGETAVGVVGDMVEALRWTCERRCWRRGARNGVLRAVGATGQRPQSAGAAR